jgi:ElaB/YqjD/DUF883 family membrane-anchored ribosome-binding protein
MTKSAKTTVADKGGRSPEEIRKDIDSTRKDLGETAAAVAEKTDVKKQAQAKADELKAGAADKAEQAKAKVQELGEKTKEAAPESAEEGVHQAQEFAQKNPIPVAIGVSLLVGFILGRIFSR